MPAITTVSQLEHASTAVRLERLQREAWQDLHTRLVAAVDAARSNVGPGRVALAELVHALQHAALGLAAARQREERASHTLGRLFPVVS